MNKAKENPEKQRLKAILERYMPNYDSIEDCSRAVGIKAGTFRTYLSITGSLPTPENQLKIAEFLGISHRELMARIYGFSPESSQKEAWEGLTKPASAEEAVLLVSSLPTREKLLLARHLMDEAIAG